MAVRRSPQTRQRDPERTKGAILRAAVSEFAAKGYAGARVGEIADRAGVNKQLISYYFGGKEGLYRTIARKWLDDQQEAASAQREMDLPTLAADFIARDSGQREHSRLLAWEGLTAGEDPGEPVRTERMQRAIADLRRRQAEGEIPPELDVGCLLLVCMAAAAAPVTLPHVARSIFGPDTDPDSKEFVDRYAEQFMMIVRRIANG